MYSIAPFVECSSKFNNNNRLLRYYNYRVCLFIHRSEITVEYKRLLSWSFLVLFKLRMPPSSRSEQPLTSTCNRPFHYDVITHDIGPRCTLFRVSLQYRVLNKNRNCLVIFRWRVYGTRRRKRGSWWVKSTCLNIYIVIQVWLLSINVIFFVS